MPAERNANERELGGVYDLRVVVLQFTITRRFERFCRTLRCGLCESAAFACYSLVILALFVRVPLLAALERHIEIGPAARVERNQKVGAVVAKRHVYSCGLHLGLRHLHLCNTRARFVGVQWTMRRRCFLAYQGGACSRLPKKETHLVPPPFLKMMGL